MKFFLVKPVTALLAVSTLSILPLCAMAESKATLETVVITATRSDQKSVVTPNNVTVINREQLDHMASSTLSTILRTQAGIQIQDFIGDGSRAAISMRGFGENAANNTLVMIDGRKLNNPTSQAPDLSAVKVSDIERIEIIQGGGGVLYGDQAVGGVINIITKQASRDAQTSIESTRGTDDLEVYRGSTSQMLGNGFAYRASAEEKRTNNYRDNNEADYSNYFLRLEQHGDSGSLFAETQRIDDNLRLPGSLNATQVKADRRQTTKPNEFSNYATLMHRLGGELHLSQQWDLLGDYTFRDANGKINQFSAFEQDTRVYTFSPRLAGKLPSTHGLTYVTLGYDWLDSDYQNTASGFEKDATQKQQGLYGQVSYPFLPQWSVTAGMRQSKAEDDDKRNNKNNEDTESTTEIGINWTPSEQLRLFARSAEVLRFANADENSSTLPGVSFLKPQTGVSHEAGLDFSAGRWNAKATLFDMTLDDEIFYDANQFYNVNMPKSNRQGLLLSGDVALTESFILGTNWTLLDTKVEEGSFKGYEIPFVANHTSTTWFDWALPGNLQLYADAVYTGTRFQLNDDDNSKTRLDNFWLYNLAISSRWQQLHASLRINNLLNEEYSTLESTYNYQYTAPERTLELTARYEF
jgi:iron complex outermembrane receptor protein